MCLAPIIVCGDGCVGDDGQMPTLRIPSVFLMVVCGVGWWGGVFAMAKPATCRTSVVSRCRAAPIALPLPSRSGRILCWWSVSVIRVMHFALRCACGLVVHDRCDCDPAGGRCGLSGAMDAYQGAFPQYVLGEDWCHPSKIVKRGRGLWQRRYWGHLVRALQSSLLPAKKEPGFRRALSFRGIAWIT